MKKEIDAQIMLQAANKLLLQRDKEIEIGHRKWETKGAELEKSLRIEIVSLEDASNAMFEQGFNQVVAQVKQFNTGVLINFTMVNQ